MKVGETRELAGWKVKLNSVTPVVGDNWVALEGALAAQTGDSRVYDMRPQARNFFTPVQATNEAALLTRWNGQLYAVIAPVEGAAGSGPDALWQVRLWWKPFVTFIWLGGGLIAFGGFLALIGRMFRRFKFRRGGSDWSTD
jgi:cytochrome c-type biogenesis protein CcmF